MLVYVLFIIILQISLKAELIDKKSEISASQTEIEKLRGKVKARDEEIEEIKCQFTSLNNLLEVNTDSHINSSHPGVNVRELKCY